MKIFIGGDGERLLVDVPCSHVGNSSIIADIITLPTDMYPQ